MHDHATRRAQIANGAASTVRNVTDQTGKLRPFDRNATTAAREEAFTVVATLANTAMKLSALGDAYEVIQYDAHQAGGDSDAKRAAVTTLYQSVRSLRSHTERVGQLIPGLHGQSPEGVRWHLVAAGDGIRSAIDAVLDVAPFVSPELGASAALR